MKSVGIVLVPYETNGTDAAQGCWSSFLTKAAIQAVLAINTSLSRLCGLTQQLPTASRSPLPFPLVGQGGEMDKRGNSLVEIKTV